jgi:hypothetical protein
MDIRAAAAVCILIGCPKAKRPCDEYEQAQRMLDQVSNETLDPTFGDPKYAKVLAAFDAIGEDCEQHEAAKTVAQTIRTAMAEKGSAVEAPIVDVAPPPPAAPAAAPADDMAKKVAEYFEKADAIDAGPDGNAGGHVMAMLVDGFQKGGDFSGMQAELARAAAGMRSLTPPEPCREYHQQSLELLAMMSSLFRSLETAIAQEDEEALGALDEKEKLMDAELKRLEEMRKELERRFNL